MLPQLVLYEACPALAPAGALPPVEALRSPSAAHPRGADDLGRDMLMALQQGAGEEFAAGRRRRHGARAAGRAWHGAAGEPRRAAR
jgi:hypothetical protein